MKSKLIIPVTLSFLISFCSCHKESDNSGSGIMIIQANGDIHAKVESFRSLLGPLNAAPGAVSGRQEVNWDGVPESLNDKALPGDFFNPADAGAPASRQRGLSYKANGGTFRVSNNNFAGINSAAAVNFAAFSGSNTFANTGAALWPVSFQKPGTTISASVQGFGAVFSDVDKDNTTSLEFFNGAKSLGKFFVPPHDDKSSFSFLGIYLQNDERITDVVVSHDGFLEEGTKDVSEGGTRDLVVLDDFIYGEPK